MGSRVTRSTRTTGSTSSTRTTLPLPGSGDTAARFLALWEGCRADVSEGRLAEADHDADAILAEIGDGRRVADGEFWGVWAAEPPHPVLEARRDPAASDGAASDTAASDGAAADAATSDTDVHELTLRASEFTGYAAPGIEQEHWVFNGVPLGPTLRGKVGDEFVVTLFNDGTMSHSVDFHAGMVSPDEPMRDIAPGESLLYRIRAGETVRFWLVVAGPNKGMSFHVVGTQFHRMYKEGALQLGDGDGGGQALSLSAAQGGYAEARFPEPGMAVAPMPSPELTSISMEYTPLRMPITHAIDTQNSASASQRAGVTPASRRCPRR